MGCRGVEGGGGEHGGGGCDRAGSGGRGCDGSGGAGRRPKGIRTRVPVCRSIHQEAATQAGLRGRRLLISIADKEAVSEARAQTKKGPAFAWPLLSLGCHLLQQRHQQQRDEVDDFDRGIDRRDRKSKRLNSSHECPTRMPSSATT